MKKKLIPMIVIIALIIIIGSIYGVQLYMEHFAYSKEKADLTEYFSLSDDSEAALVIGSEQIEEKAKIKDGNYYVSYDVLKNNISNRFYYGADDGILVYTTPTKTITAAVGSTGYSTSDGEEADAGYEISYLDGETLYVNLNYVKEYSAMTFEAFDSPNRIQMYVGLNTVQSSVIKKKTQLRVLGGIKSEVLTELNEDDSVVVLEAMDEWSKVQTNDAFIGYVENKFLSDTQEMVKGTELSEELSAYTNISMEGKVNLGFHSIGGIAGNETITGVLEQAKGLNAIAPTWFSLTGSDGSITSYATNDYVTACHAANIQVWAVVDNFNGNGDADTEAVLSHAASRAKLVSGLMEAVSSYSIDGINVDFENIPESYARDYVQFLRELSVACRANGVVMSIDNYVPMNFNDHYDLTEQGIIADYVVIMGYDEHYAGSEEAGSVASIDYVSNGINNALNEVSADKLINAIPFYTRLWTTENGAVSSKALHMSGAQAVIEENGVELVWDETTCQYYGEFTNEDGNLCQIWNEDARSIEAKLSVMQTANIAGVAEWALGFETADIWDVINTYMAQ